MTRTETGSRTEIVDKIKEKYNDNKGCRARYQDRPGRHSLERQDSYRKGTERRQGGQEHG